MKIINVCANSSMPFYTRSKWESGLMRVRVSSVHQQRAHPRLGDLCCHSWQKLLFPWGFVRFLSPRAHIRKHSMKRARNSLPIASDAEIIFVSPFGLHLCKPFTWTLCQGPATVWIIHGHLHSPPRCFVRQENGAFPSNGARHGALSVFKTPFGRK